MMGRNFTLKNNLSPSASNIFCTVMYIFYILKAIDSHRGVLLLLLDLSAAFDTVDHEILLGRLSSRFGIKGKALDWLRSYLTDRTQLVKVDDVSSTVLPLHWGVPQGSVLGPMPYLLYTSPLGDIVREHSLSFHFLC